MGWVVCRTHPLGALRGGPGCQVCVLTWRQGLCVFWGEVRTLKPPLQPGSQLLSSHLLLYQAWGVPQARTSERNCGWCGVGSLRDKSVSQPPKEEKTADKGHSGLTTLFPGQKRRISHLSKQGKEVSVCLWVLGEWSPIYRGRASSRSLALGASGSACVLQSHSWGPHPVVRVC